MIKIIPTWVWIAAIGVSIAVAYPTGCARGKASVQDKWDASVERGRAEVERLKGAQGKVTTRIEYVTQYEVKEVRVKGDTIEKIVEVFVPTNSACMLDGGFRLYHDAAATNSIPDPARIPDAAPVSATEVARTVAENYTGCTANAVMLQQWQQWATDMCATNKEGCPANE